MDYEISRRTPRYYFVVDVELTDLQSGIHIKAKTKMLGLFGCGVDTASPFAKGTRVRLELSRRGVEVKTTALVVYASPELGMGIAFTDIDRKNERILERWIEELLSVPIRT